MYVHVLSVPHRLHLVGGRDPGSHWMLQLENEEVIGGTSTELWNSENRKGTNVHTWCGQMKHGREMIVKEEYKARKDDRNALEMLWEG